MRNVRTSQILLHGLLILTFCSCVKVSYIGNSYTPTQTIEIFYEEEQLLDSYEIMGKAVASATNDKQGQNALIKRAQEEGADAVLIEELSNAYYQNSSSTSSKLQIKAKFYRKVRQ